MIIVTMKGKNYRKGVGMVIVNREGQFFLGKRIGADAWQFPQGGIDEGETPEVALYRELFEETGLERDKVEIIDMHATHIDDVFLHLIGKCFKVNATMPIGPNKTHI